MPDGNPIIIGQANTASNPATVTRLTRSFNPQPITNPIFHVHATARGPGIRGEASTDAGVIGTGGTGLPSGTPTRGVGVVGVGTGAGVIGSTSFPGASVMGSTDGVVGSGGGVVGNGLRGSTSSLAGAGVFGSTSSFFGVGVYGKSTALFRRAVVAEGKMDVINGDNRFIIDHSLDPENKYLVHTSVESSERKNVYDGVARLDEDGAAWVDLPEWFEALNEDFRYQLTAVGGSAPNLHVAEEVSENRFKTAGGEEGMKVCWQVTGLARTRGPPILAPAVVPARAPQKRVSQRLPSYPAVFGVPTLACTPDPAL
jgi:hypothetical protein